MAALCVEGEEGGSRGGAPSVWTSRVRPDVKVETMALSDGCRLGVEAAFGSSVSDKGWVDDEEHAPDCSCCRQCRAER